MLTRREGSGGTETGKSIRLIPNLRLGSKSASFVLPCEGGRTKSTIHLELAHPNCRSHNHSTRETKARGWAVFEACTAETVLDHVRCLHDVGRPVRCQLVNIRRIGIVDVCLEQHLRCGALWGLDTHASVRQGSPRCRTGGDVHAHTFPGLAIV